MAKRRSGKPETISRSRLAKALKVTERGIEKFLVNIASGKTITESAKGTGASRERYYQLRLEQPEFAKAWEAAVDLGTGLLEDMCLKRCKHSDNLLMFLLKARKPAVYGNRLIASGGPTDPANPKAGFGPVKFTFDFGSGVVPNED